MFYINFDYILFSKAGNQTATVISLACMKDEDLTVDSTLAAIRDIKGLEILINLLETKVHKCMVSIYVLVILEYLERLY